MTIQKIEGHSPEAQSADITAENIAQFKVLFPELLTESANGVAINVDVLKQLVGDATATDAEEKYGLNWHGKRRARQIALTPAVQHRQGLRVPGQLSGQHQELSGIDWASGRWQEDQQQHRSQR